MRGRLKSIIYHASPWPARLRKLATEAENVLRRRGVPCRVRAYRVVDADTPGVSPLLLVLSEVVDEPGTELDHEAVRRALVEGLNRQVGTALRREDLLISVDSMVPAAAAAQPARGGEPRSPHMAARAGAVSIATKAVETRRSGPAMAAEPDASQGAVMVREFPPEAWRQFRPTDTGALAKH